MKKTVALPVLQAKEGRETSALEKSLIRFFERELEVKLTRREMWRSVRFVASLFVLLLALSTGEPLLALPALALAAYAYRGVADITSRFTEKGGARSKAIRSSSPATTWSFGSPATRPENRGNRRR